MCCYVLSYNVEYSIKIVNTGVIGCQVEVTQMTGKKAGISHFVKRADSFDYDWLDDWNEYVNGECYFSREMIRRLNKTKRYYINLFREYKI